MIQHSGHEFKASVGYGGETTSCSTNCLCEHYHIPASVLPSEKTIDLTSIDGIAQQQLLISENRNNNHVEMVIGRFAQSVHQQRNDSQGRY
jgi:hypothetical protein